MRTTLVTGATGFLGWHVARVLVERGDRVRALARSDRNIGLDVETVPGDLRDEASLERAVERCDEVYHVAADYRLWAKDPAEMYRSNVDGTRNLLAAAQRAGVSRFIYTSTVGCIAMPPGDETAPAREDEMKGAYKHSKFLAEQVALKFAEGGFPVFIVNPTAPVGENDVKPTPTGKIILDFLKGRMPAFVDTGMNLIDARDCAAGHLLAGERGRPGERYILGSENLTLKEILDRLARFSGRPAPTMQIPYPVAYAVGVVSTAWAGVTGREPMAPIDGVRMARKKMFVSSDKATRELGFKGKSVDNALERAIEWFRVNGYV